MAQDAEVTRLQAALLEAQKSRQAIACEIASLNSRSRDLLIREQQLQCDLNALQPSPTPSSINPTPPPTPTPSSPATSIHGARFLTPEESAANAGLKVALASYPRCGNSLLRSLLEKLTGIVTGSDSDERRALIRQLKAMGFEGEGVTDGSVLAVKTHFPERLGRSSFAATKVVVLVRNPFDAIVSYFNMVLTQTHTKSIARSEFVKYRDIWREFVKEEVEYWKEFYARWLKVNDIPALLVRYEDLIQNRPAALRRLVDFLGDIQVDGLDVEARLKQVCGQEIAKAGVYAPRTEAMREAQADTSAKGVEAKSGSSLEIGGSFLSSREIYEADQVEYMLVSARDMLVRLGYWECLPAEWRASVPAPLRARKCIVVAKEEKEGSGASVVLNSVHGIRPRTWDDPNGRGFGKRWKRKLSMLPPVQMTNGRMLEWRQINFNTCQYG